ncbi:hypothetical protein TI39_contig452g00017 [Zymoseptoria brevis]|uniref:Aminoglycoside phosphotransferase domain-containing protein n=1 Tax=Zymoseptoria brevis TaxID=1047168 RepID=A0A0F4GLL3_9PEZI|nr:hypothetical protein TI39_contig452g00017 [Zymoseptoria brevis]
MGYKRNECPDCLVNEHFGAYDPDNSKPTTSELGPIPTPAEIEACTDFIVGQDRNGPGPIFRRTVPKIVKIGNYVIKFGGRTKFLEAQNLLFLADNCTARVPKCYGYGYLPGSKEAYIIMNFIEGDMAHVVYPTLDQVDQAEVIRLIGEQIAIWRSLPDPGYFGALGKKHLPGTYHQTHPDPGGWPNGRLYQGPFDSHDEFEESMMAHRERHSDPDQRKEAEPTFTLHALCLHECLKGSRSTWTHGDLQPKNIMIHKNGINADGSGIFTVTIFDWETGGWFPEWWEFATNPCFQFGPVEWFAGALPKIMPVYASAALIWAFWEEFSFPRRTF